MRILVISQYYYPEPFRINEICEELVRRGHAVKVLTMNPNYPDGEFYLGYSNAFSKEIVNGVEVFRCKAQPRRKGNINLAKNYLSFVRHASKLIKKLSCEFDCIYIYQLSPITSCIPAIWYKKKYGLPIFLYCLDIWPESLKGSAIAHGVLFELIKKLSIKIYKSADKIAVSSPSFAQYLSGLCQIEKKEIATLFQHANEIKYAKEEKNNENINFVFIGNIGESQNLECLLKATVAMKNKQNLKLHIVGSGSYFQVIKKMTEDLGLEEKVVFHGRHPKSDMPQFYALADVCLVLLKDEGITGYTIPGKVQEYMSAGKPILACMNGDTANLIKNAGCGICVSADDDGKLAEAMEWICANYKKISEWGIAAKKYYKQYFTLEKHVDQLEKLLQEMIEERNE